MNLGGRVIDTPHGPFTILVGVPADTEEPAVLASGWTSDKAALRALIRPDLLAQLLPFGPECNPPTGRPPAPSAGPALPQPATGIEQLLEVAVTAAEKYYQGDMRAIDRVPVRQESGPFRERAWAVLRTIPPARTLTYRELASQAGRPTAVRAAAGACAHNAAALFVPCHRVLRSDGGLGGFRYGSETKEALLSFEAAISRAVPNLRAPGRG